MTFDHDEFVDCMTRYKGENQPFAVATVVRTEDSTAGTPGDKVVVRADGTVTGWVGGGCTLGAVKKAAMAALADGRPRLIRVRPKDTLADDETPDGMELHGSSCPSRGTTEVFVEPVLPKPRLLIIGTSPVARTLCGLAKAMGYVVSVAGSAEELDAFAEADHRFEGFEIPEQVPANRYVVVSSQGKRDHDCLKAALATDADYIAFVGSRRKADKVKADMVADGWAQDRVAAVHSPAGMHIGAVTPDEIALSILAEIVCERRLGLNAPIAQVDAEQDTPEEQLSQPVKSGSCCGTEH